MNQNSLDVYFKSILEQDRCPIVICNLSHEIIYMNPKAIQDYTLGAKLIGRNLLKCHDKDSNEKILKIIEWFEADVNHNIVHTFYNEKENKDVYMIALRENDKLIGYYEKHEYRNPDTMKLYDLY